MKLIYSFFIIFFVSGQASAQSGASVQIPTVETDAKVNKKSERLQLDDYNNFVTNIPLGADTNPPENVEVRSPSNTSKSKSGSN